MSYHAAVWLDHNEAKIFHITHESFTEQTVHPLKQHRHLQRKRGDYAGHRVDEDPHYYHEIAKDLADAGTVLVCGPGSAKLAFIKHVHKHDHNLEPKIIGVETVDHPSDAQFVAYARKYFVEHNVMR